MLQKFLRLFWYVQDLEAYANALSRDRERVFQLNETLYNRNAALTCQIHELEIKLAEANRLLDIAKAAASDRMRTSGG